MLTINVVPEDLHFFTYMKKTANEEYTRKICETNPLYSWHAVRFCKSWSKNLLLVNDLTGFPIIIPNVAYGQKEQLAGKIRRRFVLIFKKLGLTSIEINHYFTQAGTFQYAQAFRNTSVTLAHHYAKYFTYAIQHKSEIAVIENNLTLAKMPIRKGAAFEISLDKMVRLLKELPLFSLPEKGATFYFTKNNYRVEKNWLPFSTWSDYTEINLDYPAFLKCAIEIKENNSLIFEQFERYLFEHRHLSMDEVDRHLDLIEIFLDDFLLEETINTPVSNYNDIAFFINYWYLNEIPWANETTVQQSGESLELFYLFLLYAGEISTEACKEILDYIHDGVLSGLYSIETGTSYNVYRHPQ